MYEEKEIDWTKPLKTECGQEVEFLRKLNYNLSPFLFIARNRFGAESAHHADKFGKVCNDGSLIKYVRNV